jgi:DNA modification methylase
MDKNIIYKEDCIIGFSKLPDKCVDIIITDPPYHNNKCKVNMKDYIFFCEKCKDQCLRILKMTEFYIFMDFLKL